MALNYNIYLHFGSEAVNTTLLLSISDGPMEDCLFMADFYSETPTYNFYLFLRVCESVLVFLTK